MQRLNPGIGSPSFLSGYVLTKEGEIIRICDEIFASFQPTFDVRVAESRIGGTFEGMRQSMQ